MQRETSPVTDMLPPGQSSQDLLSKQDVMGFFTRLLNEIRPYSQNYEKVVSFEKDATVWQDAAREAYDNMSKAQADQMARQILRYVQLGWYATVVQCRESVDDQEPPKTAFLDELLDSTGLRCKI